MLRDIQLPPEYAKGLQDLLLKEQQDDQLTVQTEMQQKQVRIAELQAEADAVQKVKQAEGDAHAKVVEAKGEADAMQYTLPLKQKQIEQSKLEAEARKEATIENADARGAGQGDRQQGGSAAAQYAGGCGSESHPGDGGGGCGTR